MPHVMMDSTSNPKDMMKYSPKVPVKRILLPFNSKLLKKYSVDQYIQYGVARPNVIIDNNKSPKDFIKYSPNLPVKTIDLLIFLSLNCCSHYEISA